MTVALIVITMTKVGHFSVTFVNPEPGSASTREKFSESGHLEDRWGQERTSLSGDIYLFTVAKKKKKKKRF